LSYDFEIATRRPPGPLEPLLARIGIEARLDGTFEPERNVLVTRLGDPERTIDVEGPAGYEPEDLVGDLDEAFAAAAPGASWICGIHLPGGYVEPVDRWALDLAIELARDGDGAVWDPQAEQVVWPEHIPSGAVRTNRAQERAPTVGRQRIVLAWHVPQARARPDLPATLLALLREHLPDAVPGRFGRTEPYQHRLERDGDSTFSADWAAEAAGQQLLTWDGAKGAWPGMVRFRQGDGRRLQPDLQIRIEGDDAARHDPDSADRLADGFAAVADALDAACGQAHLEPTEVELVRGVPLVRFRDLIAQGWAGLPWDPTWLTWFGRPYADRLRAGLDEFVDRETSRGFLIRMGPLALPREELRASFPRLPPELVQEEWFAVSPTDGRPIPRLRPAAEIPSLDH
jgi:hypothetical protein